MIPRKVFGVRLIPSLIDAVDCARADHSRTEYIEKVLSDAIVKEKEIGEAPSKRSTDAMHAPQRKR